MTGRIFNVQRFSVHDGPGIRTTIFFKGCNLRCMWCHNPESYLPQPQIQYFAEKCIGCGECMRVCEHGIYIKDGHRIGIEHCVLCRKCEDACMSGALKFAGQEYTAEEVIEIVLRDQDYYRNSGGGVTASGGEPLLQHEFICELFRKLKKNQISTALDTAGNVDFKRFEEVLPWTDLVLLDLKIMDEELHRRYTGSSNRQILQNAKRLMEVGQRMHIRVPVIAGVNDTSENAEALKAFIDGATNVEEIRFLPYHNMGLAKARSVEIDMRTFVSPDEERMKQIRSIFGEIAK
ncbi:MAG: glycyl-radical enzyme activating protein [Eubacteriales bacterium]|nr:glycyl-radical enzyme activating protein [Eubacteriales bacterium]